MFKILLVFLLCNQQVLYSQVNDGIEICNNKRVLRQISTNEYSLHFDGEKLISFASQDSSVLYDEFEKILSIKNEMRRPDMPEEFIALKLTLEGIFLTSQGKEVKLDTVNCGERTDCNPNREFDINLHDFMVGVVFNNNHVAKIFLATKSRNIDILVRHNNAGYYSWDIETTYMVNDGNPVKNFKLEYVSAKPYLVTMADEQKGSVYFISFKGKKLSISRMFYTSNKELIMDKNFIVKYRKGGILESVVGTKLCMQ